MAEKELNLIQLATGFTAQPCARATKIVGTGPPSPHR